MNLNLLGDITMWHVIYSDGDKAWRVFAPRSGMVRQLCPDCSKMETYLDYLDTLGESPDEWEERIMLRRRTEQATIQMQLIRLAQQRRNNSE